MGIMLSGINFEGKTYLGLAATVPDSPTGATATGGNAQATVTFAMPISNGGSAITGYTVVSSPSGGTDTNAGTTGLSHVVTGLTNGVSYTFQVYATNALGNGPNSSSSNAVTPINSDPYWANVTILLTGESASATPVVSFNSPATPSYSQVAIENSATQSKFGSKSVWLKGSTSVNSWADIGSSTGTAFRGAVISPNVPSTMTTPFTVETFYRGAQAPNAVFATYTHSGNGYGGWALKRDFSGVQILRLQRYSSLGSASSMLSVPFAYTVNTWTNIAMSFDGTTTYIFVNGVLGGTTTTPLYKVDSWTGFKIGSVPNSLSPSSSYWDETRLTVGVCRYTSNYTVATEPYPQV